MIDLTIITPFTNRLWLAPVYGAMVDHLDANRGPWVIEYIRIEVPHYQPPDIGRWRKLGLDVAKGESVLFVDSDDYVDPSVLKTCLHARLEMSMDIVIGPYVRACVDSDWVSAPFINAPLTSMVVRADYLRSFPWPASVPIGDGSVLENDAELSFMLRNGRKHREKKARPRRVADGTRGGLLGTIRPLVVAAVHGHNASASVRGTRGQDCLTEDARAHLRRVREARP